MPETVHAMKPQEKSEQSGPIQTIMTITVFLNKCEDTVPELI